MLAGAYNFSLLDTATMELFPGEEDMRDKRGSSVSLFHLSQTSTWGVILSFLVFIWVSFSCLLSGLCFFHSVLPFA